MSLNDWYYARDVERDFFEKPLLLANNPRFLAAAAVHGNVKIVQRILAINPMADRSEALTAAVKENHTTTARVLLESPNGERGPSITFHPALLQYASARENAELIGLLLKAGMSPEARDREEEPYLGLYHKGMSPVHIAFSHKNMAVMTALVQGGVVFEGASTFATAIQEGFREAVEIYLERHTLDGYWLHFALETSLCHAQWAVPMLLRRGAALHRVPNVPFTGSMQTPALHTAISSPWVRPAEVLPMLAEFGADLEATDGALTAVQHAQMFGMMGCAAILRGYGAQYKGGCPAKPATLLSQAIRHANLHRASLAVVDSLPQELEERLLICSPS